jgi:FkbM family methyltransferase
MKPLLLRKAWDVFSNSFPKVATDLNYLRRYKNYETDLWHIPAYCNREAAVIDVGANMGIFSRWMAKHASHVHSFECNPNLFTYLDSFLPGNTTLHKYALSSTPGKQTLRFDPANTGIGTIEQSNLLDRNPGIKTVTGVDVNVRRLDDFELGPVSFIKIDVEGHELEVLKGSGKLLSKYKPTLLIEIVDDHCPGNLDAVPKWLEQFGYKAFILNATGKLVPVQQLEEYSAEYYNYWFKVN